MIKEQEGVIKYQLDHCKTPLSNDVSITTINAWRTIFYKLDLIGQIAERYDGLGFGNISQRIHSIDADNKQFIISGTQTGKLESLSKRHYCTILSANTANNSIQSAGETLPSSEALTHASVYQQHTAIQSIIHIHCPHIWQNTHQLKLAYTQADISYGTPEMANEITRLYQTEHLFDSGIFSMLGHEDGIIAFSSSMEKTACALISLYAQAISIKQ